VARHPTSNPVPRGRRAVFGDASKVRYTPLTTQQRFTALQSGE